jgi:hypothetical protein
MFFAGSVCRAFADQKLLLGKQLVSAGTIAIVSSPEEHGINALLRGGAGLSEE